MQTPRAITEKDVPRVIGMTKLILRKAKKAGIEMRSNEAKRLAMQQLGLMGEREFKKLKAETAVESNFMEGMRSAMPRYRNL